MPAKTTTRPFVLTGSGLAVTVLFRSTTLARTLRVGEAEERFFRGFNNAPDTAFIPVWAVMQSGSLAAVFVTSAELARRGELKTAGVALAAGTLVWAGVKKAKPFIGRGRPAAHLDDVHVRGEAQTGLGFPSGHAAVSMTLALVATRNCSAVIRAAAVATSGFTGCARMYVGAHLPLDVAGGFAAGILAGRFANSIAFDRLH